MDKIVVYFPAISDLHSIGGLVPLLGYLKSSNSEIRAKAADVVTTIVQNNPRSQQLVMEANGMQPLLANFTSDPDVTVRTKALGAISCELFVEAYFIFFIWHGNHDVWLGAKIGLYCKTAFINRKNLYTLLLMFTCCVLEE